MAAVISSRSHHCEARLYSRKALPEVLDSLVRQVRRPLGASRMECTLKAGSAEFESAKSVTHAYKKAEGAGVSPRVALLTLSDDGEVNVLHVRVDNCRAAKPYVRFEVHGPDAGLWMERVRRALNNLSNRGRVEYPLRGVRRLTPMTRKVIAFLTGELVWVQIVGGTIAILLAWFLTR